MLISTHKIQRSVGISLFLGTLISTLLVLLGGIFFLLQYGDQTVDLVELSSKNYPINVVSFFQTFQISAISFIELGLIFLVATQIMRVGLLAIVYALRKDYKFVSISLFILIILLISFIWQK